MTKSFYSWVLQFKNDNTPTGDIAREVRWDEGFPRRSVSHRYLKDYLESMNACASAMNAFEKAFSHYEKEIKLK